VLVLSLICGMALILHFVSQTEMKRERRRSRQEAYYLAESGTERGENRCRCARRLGQPQPGTADRDRGGAQQGIDFNPASVRPQFSGCLRAFRHGDDTDPRPDHLGRRSYAAYPRP
jgi:hypothetical protein